MTCRWRVMKILIWMISYCRMENGNGSNPNQLYKFTMFDCPYSEPKDGRQQGSKYHLGFLFLNLFIYLFFLLFDWPMAISDRFCTKSNLLVYILPWNIFFTGAILLTWGESSLIALFNLSPGRKAKIFFFLIVFKVVVVLLVFTFVFVPFSSSLHIDQ